MTNKIAFLFPGQGSQVVGMGREMAQTYPEAAAIYSQADELLHYELSKLCWYGPEADLNETVNTQPAIFTTSVACLAAMRAAGFTTQPDFVAGHSLGEYAAYVAAGVLSFAEGLTLVRKRGELMARAGRENPGRMAAFLKLSDAVVTEICERVSRETAWVQVANYNCPGQVVISGTEAGIDRAIELAQEAGARRAQKLTVSIAAHSQLMAVVSADFQAAVDAALLSPPQVPLVANITARPLSDVPAIRAEMVGQLTESVRWSESIRYMIEQGVSHFIELGSKNVLTGLMKRIDRGVSAFNVEDPAGIDNLLPEVL